jgi:hypothetical protein
LKLKNEAAGWHRFYDEKKSKFYYANLKLNKSKWTRPELDPLFLDESILFNFTEREVEHLKTLFDEEMHHFGLISPDRLVDLLSFGVGEQKVNKKIINSLFKTYCKVDFKILLWAEFMNIINAVKLNKISASKMLRKPIEIISVFFSQFKVKTMLLKPTRKKLGNW